jgi:hypothetical protein
MTAVLRRWSSALRRSSPSFSQGTREIDARRDDSPGCRWGGVLAVMGARSQSLLGELVLTLAAAAQPIAGGAAVPGDSSTAVPTRQKTI